MCPLVACLGTRTNSTLYNHAGSLGRATVWIHTYLHIRCCRPIARAGEAAEGCITLHATQVCADAAPCPSHRC